ncbi:hypothetical protein E4U42_007594 [Claviceps africana]|uniref:BTB domain-containing protein n=1 Tax=Claviceps africana TaxID=83212 RepID=A0A8K0J1K2_9HYPO|nr:hypothetical protein E4U42_007594 [Claviceps africana]
MLFFLLSFSVFFFFFFFFDPAGFGCEFCWILDVTMQASPYESIVTSPPFKFIVGATKTDFFLHAALVASQSRALDRMINGPFAEGQQGHVVLAEEDTRTVAAFAEFLYKGDYHFPSDMAPPDSVPKTMSKRAKANASHQEEWSRPGNEHWSKFTQNPAYGYDKSSATPVLNAGSLDADYSEFFIAHAKVFVFADCYGVEGLAELAMQKLHAALCGFRLSRERLDDVLALVRFCYERPGPDKLRRLVASYTAGIVDSASPADCFRGVLQERGDFAADVAWFLACRLVRSAEC